MTITSKYRAYLQNKQGCVFDCCNFASLTALRSWARGRGGVYQLIIEKRDGIQINYTVRNNRITVNH